MTEPQRTEQVQQPDDEREAPEPRIEDLDIGTDDAAEVKGGIGAITLIISS